MKTNFLFIVLACLLISTCMKAQDTIVKITGEIIPAKITEVGMTTLTYKKANFDDGPSFVINKTDVLQVRYRNGRREDFAKLPDPNAISGNTLSPSNSSNPMNQNNSSSSASANQNQQNNQKPVKGLPGDEYKIQTDGKKFFVNGQKIGQKDVDRLLSRSKNPAVVVAAKTAKITKVFQKITKITSFGTTAGGGAACISTFRTVYLEATQKGGHGAQPSSWVNAGVSFVGTMAFPITAKILKKQRVKLYDKAIDLYNLDKK